jgi:ATP synthase protein I
VKKPRTLKDPPIGSATPKFSPQSQLGFAWRVGTEFISGIFVGLLLGYAIDHVFDAKPWGLVVMVILGAAAGILNIFRMLGFWGTPSPKAVTPKSKGEKKDG